MFIIKSCDCDSKTNLRSVSIKVSEKYCFKAQPCVYVQDLTLIYSLLTLHYFILYIVLLNVDFSIFLLVFTHFSVLCGVRRTCSDEGAFSYHRQVTT